jgi:16S rRNA (adenine1518-N6/adenine1519-N6)-dimethyltransferase
MTADLAGLARGFDGPVRLVSNLPYSISGPLLRRLLDLRELLEDWSVMLQREVGQRLLAPPGGRSYGSLTVLHGLVARSERLMELSPRGFFPTPRVDSTFIRVVPLAQQLLAPGELPAVERVVRAAFGNRRKTLVNALGAAKLAPPERLRGALEALGIDPRARGETLTPPQFLALTRALTGAGPGAGG